MKKECKHENAVLRGNDRIGEGYCPECDRLLGFDLIFNAMVNKFNREIKKLKSEIKKIKEKNN